MRDSMHILDQLRERGYEPHEHWRDREPFEQWFDRRYEDATLRLTLTDDEARLFAFDRHMALDWQARFADGTPTPVILAALDAAERIAAGNVVPGEVVTIEEAER